MQRPSIVSKVNVVVMLFGIATFGSGCRRTSGEGIRRFASGGTSPEAWSVRGLTPIAITSSNTQARQRGSKSIVRPASRQKGSEDRRTGEFGGCRRVDSRAKYRGI